MHPLTPRFSITLLAYVAAAVPALAETTAANEPGLANRLVHDLHSAFGAHHARAVHAKGVVLEGRFEPAADARQLSSANLFHSKAQVIVRFSDFPSSPDAAENTSSASPRGMAIRFSTEGGDGMDIVAHNYNGFPVARAEDFATMLEALAASGDGAAQPTPIQKFLGDHPAAAAFLTRQKQPPVSYATDQYYGVNAFAFVDATGARTYVRYRFSPQAGEHYLNAAQLADKGPDYLRKEIAARLKAGPIRFDWYAQIAAAGDVIDDPSTPWPEHRKLVKLGTLTITNPMADQVAADKALLFLPNEVPPGIEMADPMVTVRSAAYPISYGERQ